MTIQMTCIASLPCDMNEIKSFAIKQGDYYCLESSGRTLIKCSPGTQSVERISLERKYCLLCYDQTECCYWALGDTAPWCLYRLDHSFCELGHILLERIHKKKPLNLCCDSRGEGIWLCYPSELVLVEKASQALRWYQNQDRERPCCKVLLQGGYRVNAYEEGDRQILEILSSCCGNCLELCVPCGYQLLCMSACGCEDCCGHCHFWAIISKACSRECLLLEYCISCCSEATKPSCSPCCPPSCSPCCPPSCSPCCPPPCPPLPPGSGTYELLHSIALEEMGISHILNAEGEKIQKAVALSDTIEELICVNESVKQTLTQVTLLEGMLYSKLEAVLNCDGQCCPMPPPCPPPCVPCCHSPDSCP